MTRSTVDTRQKSCGHSILTCCLFLLTFVGGRALAGDVVVTLPASDGFVVKDSTGSTERLRIDEATGNVSRNGALFVHTTGAGGTFVGESAGNISSTGAGNTALGFQALNADTAGALNTAVGWAALKLNTEGTRNSALGDNALGSNTTGSSNSAVGSLALFTNTTGTANSAMGAYALKNNTEGSGNSAFGASALSNNTTGAGNGAFGNLALYANQTGSGNVGVGHNALRYNTASSANSAFGFYAGVNATGSYNAAFGHFSLVTTSGNDNSAFGAGALASLAAGSHSGNIAIGRSAGSSLTAGANNIYIGSAGAASESGAIRIGTSGTHTSAQMFGIFGATAASGSQVYITSNGELGTSTSSLRFKENVRNIGEESALLMKLRPVAFEYKEEAVIDEGGHEVPQYGLIAEEVADVAPELVVYGKDGAPYSVRYHLLPPLMLNEMQRLERELGERDEAIRRLSERLSQLEATLKPEAVLALEAVLKPEAGFEREPAPAADHSREAGAIR